MNFSSIPTVDEIEISMIWDVQGYLYDYLTVEYSIDNGSSGLNCSFDWLVSSADLLEFIGVLVVVSSLD